MTSWLGLVGAAVLSLAPVGVALAQSDGADPTLECSLVGAHILTDDVNGARVACHVVGAPGGDTRFTVSANQPIGNVEPRLLCSDGLTAGVGSCFGGLVDPANSLSLSATLQPSGITVGPVTIRAASAQPITAPMQFFPLGD